MAHHTAASDWSTTLPGPSASERMGSGVRPEIQALRALAVVSVLVFHLWPTRLPGGFVGVDVFFVVSGFLITAHLLREQQRTGKIALGRFWARRARRLLPASMLVLMATAAAVYLVVPTARWSQFGSEIIASTLYAENWTLAWQSVDYMALSNVKSPTQHFWTLGVEEQFYIVWPLLLVLISALAPKLGRLRGKAMMLGIGAIVIASLLHSILFTSTHQSMAYFFTTTRAWEFGFGALLSILLARRTTVISGPWVAAIVSWLGFAMILASVLLFGPATPFPSFTALLPVVGTCLVILAGAPSSRFSASAAMRSRPVQFVGDISYGVYLWHWPLIVLLPFVLLRELSTAEKIGVLVASIALGWLSKIVVEDPIRTGHLSSVLGNRWVFATVAAAMALMVVCTLPMALWRPTPVPAPGAVPVSCVGAEAMLDEDCGDAASIPLIADLSSFSADNPPEEVLACEVSAQADNVRRCDFGDDSAPRIAIVGDSHATRWVEAISSISSDAGWSTSTFLISGCPAFVDALVSTAWGYPETADNCRRLSDDAVAQVEADPTIDIVLLTNRTRLYITSEDNPAGLTQDAVAATITRLENAGKTVIVFKDPPEMNGVPPQGGGSASDCLSRASGPNDCTLVRSDAAFDDPLAAAATRTGAPLISLDDAFCDAERCYARAGGLVIYSDDNHVTRSFAASARTALAEQLDPVLSTAG
ncbi:acyltransferase family protein [Microbacterium sp. A196]|uniref:acyltransferase family protein n=1 Tax=Microbacterium sp. A196 TaxID=3457320 RepID=UPI003FD5BAC1